MGSHNRSHRLIHSGDARKSFGAVLDQAVNGEVLTHVLEEVFLAPPREHRHGHASDQPGSRYRGWSSGGHFSHNAGALRAPIDRWRAVPRARPGSVAGPPELKRARIRGLPSTAGWGRQRCLRVPRASNRERRRLARPGRGSWCRRA